MRYAVIRLVARAKFMPIKATIYYCTNSKIAKIAKLFLHLFMFSMFHLGHVS